jgi:hypothetical protein
VRPINIQGGSGGMVNILGHDRVGHCEKNCSHKHGSNSEWSPKYSCLNVKRKSTLKGTKEREIVVNLNFNVVLK